jgi:hypothetical protein
MFERHFVAYGVRIGLRAERRAALDALEEEPARTHVAFAWRALRMKRPQIAHFENLPFRIATPAATLRAEDDARKGETAAGTTFSA